jgi:glycosyltransferase involved in cell wall biosynthesis
MRVLQLASNPVLGGTETFLLRLVPALQSAGIESSLVNLWNGGGSLRQAAAAIPDFDFHYFDAGTRVPDPRGLYRFWRFLHERKFDVINAYGLRANFLLRFLFGLPGRPARVCGLRGLDLWRRWYHVAADRWTEFRIDAFVANSEEVRRIRLDRERSRPEKVALIPNGIDHAYFSRTAVGLERPPIPKASGDLWCTTVANFRPQKGHAFLLEVVQAYVQKFPHSRLRFVWVGNGQMLDRFRQAVHTAGIADRVVIVPDITDVRSILAASDCFLLPSKEEGMPRALMEAMSMELPTLATRVGGVPEVVVEGETGYTFGHGDIATAVEALEKMQCDETRSRMGHTGRTRIVDVFSEERMVSRFVDFYRQVQTIRSR